LPKLNAIVQIMVITAFELSLLSIAKAANLWIRTIQLTHKTHTKYSIRPSTLEGKLLGWWREFENLTKQHHCMTQRMNIPLSPITTAITRVYLCRSYAPLDLLLRNTKFLKNEVQRYITSCKQAIHARSTLNCDNDVLFRMLCLNEAHMGWVLDSVAPHHMKWLSLQQDAKVVNELIHSPTRHRIQRTNNTLRHIISFCRFKLN